MDSYLNNLFNLSIACNYKNKNYFIKERIIMKKGISLLLSFIMVFSLFSPIIEAIGLDLDNSTVNEGYIEESLDSYIETSENVIGIIPENVEELGDDMGLSDFIIADIKPFSTFSLRQPISNTVEIDVSELESDTVDILHFVEDASMVSDDMPILNVSEYSEASKDILRPAIMAYQEKYDSNDEFVVIEVFEDLEVVDGITSFTVDSFSIFAVGSFNITYYEFYVDGVFQSKQVIVEEGVLVAPKTPYKEDYEFLGWQIEGTSDFVVFEEVDAIASETIKCNAVFDFVRYVYFLYEAKEGGYVLDTLSGKPGDVIYTDQVDYPINLDKHVISWHTDTDLTSTPVESLILGDTDITLYPNIQEGHWLTFYSNGGTITEPHFYAINESVTAPVEPQKEGYQFMGWVDKDNNLFEFNGQLLTESCILYADWQPLQVEYTVQIMLQDPNILTDYNPVDTAAFKKYAEVKTEVLGNSITTSELETLINGLSNSNYFKKNLDFFYLNTEKTQSSKITVAGDGSSVLYVYYDRYPCTIKFYLNATDYTAKNLYKSITGRFDSDLAFADWVIPSESEVPNFINWYNPESNIYTPWTGYYNYALNYLTFDADKEEWVFELYAITSTSCTWEISYYLQNLNPDGTVSDVGYTLENDHKTKPNLNALTPTDSSSEVFKKNWNKLQIDNDLGVTSDMLADNSWSLYNISYHASNSAFSFWDDPIAGFTLVAFTMDSFDSNGKKGDEFAVHRVDPRTQAYFAYQDDNVTVDGSKPMESGRWYAISEGVALKNIFGHLYCRYLRNSYNLEFIADGQTVEDFDVYFETDLGLDKFMNVSEELDVPDGYRFEGWYTAADLSENSRFDLTKNTMPPNDVKLYAKWIPKIVDIDVHITLDGSDTIIEGVNGFTVKYAEKVDMSRVDALKEYVHIPDEALWYGWFEKVNVGGGKELLVPFNFDKQLIKDLVLYPFYSYTTPVQLHYNLNGGTGIAPVDDNNYALGKGAVVLSDTTVVPPQNKVFVAWNTEPDGSGKSYYPGDVAIIDIDDMSLYAIYENDVTLDKVALTYVNTLSLEEKTFECKKTDTTTIKNNSVFSITTSPKYIFKEWNTMEDGSGVSYSYNDVVHLTDSDNKLYTIWEIDPNYDISVIYINPLTAEEKIYDYTKLDKIVIKDSNIFEIPFDSKYVFYGWNTAEDGKGTAYRVNDTPTLTGVTTLYAIWKERTYTPTTKYAYTIYYKDKDGNDLLPKEEYKGRLNEVVTAKPKNIDGFICNMGEQDLKITRIVKDNVIIFEYIKEYKVPNHKYLDYDLNHKLYIVGYEDGTVRPENNITRAETATIFYRLLRDDVQKQYKTEINKFTDVNEDNWFNVSVSTLANIGVIGGYSDGSFKPNQYITRAEFVALMIKLFDINSENVMNRFTDVSENDWYYNAILASVNKGFIAGYPDGSFKPNQFITRAEACKIVNKMLDRKPTKPGFYNHLIDWPDLSENAWYYLDMVEATHSHIADYNYFKDNLENWNK